MRIVMILACLAAPVPALAQGVNLDDPAAVKAAAAAVIEPCLDAGTDPEQQTACVMQAARKCIDEAETPNTITQSICFAAELDVWKDRLNTAYDNLFALHQTADAEAGTRDARAPALQAAQEAWLAWRNAECAYSVSAFNGGSGGGPAEASCELTLTASRAIQLDAEVRAAAE